MKLEFLFAWYDLWIGLYWNQENRWLYILPLPTIGIIIKLNYKCPKCKKRFHRKFMISKYKKKKIEFYICQRCYYKDLER